MQLAAVQDDARISLKQTRLRGTVSGSDRSNDVIRQDGLPGCLLHVPGSRQDTKPS